GVQYTQAEIDGWIATTGTALFPEQPTPVTHGTIVAGCAAGNGRAFADFVTKHGRPADVSTTDLVGAAPNADIVFVARQGVNDASIVADATAVCDAFAYV